MARGRQRRIRQLAAALAVLWVAGFELGPNVHIGFHELFGHHHHGADHDEGHGHHGDAHHGDAHHGDAHHGDVHHADAHHHGGDAHRDHGDAEPSKPDRDSDPDHGARSLEHRGIATLTPPPPALVPPAAYVGEADEPLALLEQARDGTPRTVRQRGPPGNDRVS
jgi:hypothetical protein